MIDSVKHGGPNHKGILFLCFVAIFCSTFYLFFQTAFPNRIIFSIFNNADEVIVIFLFIYALLKRNVGVKNLKLLAWLGVLFIIGAIGNIRSHSPQMVMVLGAFSMMKPILLFWSLSQFRFEWNDLKYFLKLFTFFFPFVVVSYVADLIFPSFRSIFGRGVSADSDHGGMRSLCGIFYRPTYATIWGLMYYVYYRYYTSSRPSKFKYVFSLMMQIFSFKVKDMLGLIAGLGSASFKRISQSKFLIIALIMSLAFALYANLMPDHYQKYIGGASDDGNIARVALMYTAPKIALDKFPFGVGWGMYGSPVSRQTKSPVYVKYGIGHVYGLNFARDEGKFMCDTFWPMIVGELGALGTLLYLYILWLCFGPFLKSFKKNTSDRRFLMPSFIFIVLFIETIGKQTLIGPPHCLVVWGIAGMFYSLSQKKYPYKEF